MIASLLAMLPDVDATSGAGPHGLAKLPTFGDELLHMLLPLAIIVVGLVAVAFLLRRLRRGPGATGTGRSLRVAERLDLGMRQAILVVEGRGRSLLIGVSGERMTLLSEERVPERTDQLETDAGTGLARAAIASLAEQRRSFARG